MPGSVLEGDHQVQNAEELERFRGVTEITGSLAIAGGAVDDLEELSSITTIGGDLTISDTNLPDLKGLRGLTAVGWNVNVEDNAVLETLDGLNALNSVGNLLGIARNTALRDVGGLSGLSRLGGRLVIVNNFAVPECQVEQLLARLQENGWEGAKTIFGTISCRGVCEGSVCYAHQWRDGYDWSKLSYSLRVPEGALGGF